MYNYYKYYYLYAYAFVKSLKLQLNKYKHDGRITTTPLAARKVSHRIQDTRYCVSCLT